MNRVATIPLQRTMSNAIQHSQQLLAATQAQLSTGKKAPDFASLGTEAVRNLSSRSLLAQQDAYTSVASRVGTTLSLYDASLSAIDSSTSSLKQSILDAIGTGQAGGLQESITAAFDQFRASLNASESGMALFGGTQTDRSPFTPATLADTIGLAPSLAFVDDGVKASARMSDQLDVQYGVTAGSIGKDLYTAFQTLAGAGTISGTPTAAQLATLATAASQLDTGLSSLREVSAGNGRIQAQAEQLGVQAGDRSLLLSNIVENNEDADLGQVAIDLAQQKTMLQASYSVFSQLSSLSLSSYLR